MPCITASRASLASAARLRRGLKWPPLNDHNWFLNNAERTPSLRFGTGHIYDNYFQNVTNGIHSRMGAQMLIENNVWRSSGVAITTTGSSTQDGYANMRGNDLGGATVDITQVGTFTQAPYSYTLDPTSSVISEVTAYAGVLGGTPPPPTPTPTMPTPTQTPTPTPAPTQTPTPVPTTTPVSGASCRVGYSISNQWTGGFQVNLTITNTSSSALNGWSLVFSFPGSQQITQVWSGNYVQQGSQVTITNASYNGLVAAGASVNPSSGFLGSWNGSNPSPTSFTLNGTTCSQG